MSFFSPQNAPAPEIEITGVPRSELEKENAPAPHGNAWREAGPPAAHPPGEERAHPAHAPASGSTPAQPGERLVFCFPRTLQQDYA